MMSFGMVINGKPEKKIKSNNGFWIPKIERNTQRCDEVNKVLKEIGYAI